MARTKSAGGVKRKVRELKWPALGVVRRNATEGTPDFQPPFPAHWAVNCRLEDPLAKRLRGGSRPGLTLWDDGLNGATISSMLPITTKSESSVTSVLVLVANAALAMIRDGALTLSEGVSSECLISRGPKVYAVASGGIAVLDPLTAECESLEASVGTVPTGCTHGCFYRDRLVLANNAIRLSRQGDPTDWDYGVDVEDSGRALKFQLSEASEIGGTPTAFLPFQDTTLLAATQRSLWLIQGDPAAAGSLRNLSRGVGILGPRAWCAIQDGRVGDTLVKYGFAFLSELGLFLIAPSGDGLQSLSEDRLPDELRDIPETTTVSLVYSPDERGIYVFAAPASGVGTHWFFDLVHRGFWPMRFEQVYVPETDSWSPLHEPIAACRHDGKVLLACKDGSLRSMGGSDDDGVDIDSYVLVGPVRLAGPDVMGILTEIQGMIGQGGAGVAWKIVAGDTAEEACAHGAAAIAAYQAGDTATAEAYVKAAGSWQPGRSLTRYPRVRGMWISILLIGGGPWAYESMVITSREAGRSR